jgi:alkaline phosphatase
MQFSQWLSYWLSLNACVQKQVQVSKAAKKPKNVILLIGDGMGPEQLGLLLTYARQAPNSVFMDGKTSFDRIMDDCGIMGFSMTNANNVLVTDSAAFASHQAHRSMENEIAVDMLNSMSGRIYCSAAVSDTGFPKKPMIKPLR